MSGQIDVGWSAPPFGLDLIDQNKIIASLPHGNDAAAFKGQTVAAPDRQPAGPAGARRRHQVGICKPIARRWIGNIPTRAVLEHYAAWLNIPLPTRATHARRPSSPSRRSIPTGSLGLDTIVNDAVELKYTPGALDQGAARRTDSDPAAVAGRAPAKNK